jgi:hypothetical protein
MSGGWDFDEATTAEAAVSQWSPSAKPERARKTKSK